MAELKSHIKTDPLRNFKFLVSIYKPGVGTANMGFMSASGLNVSTEVIPYREGGMNTTTQKMPGQSDFAPLTFTKGLVVGEGLMITWLRELFTVIQGSGTGGANNDFRATVDIKIQAHPWTASTKPPVKAAFRTYNAWPTSLAYSDLDAGANAIIVQQMTLAHEGFETKLANDGGTGPASVKF